MFRFIWQKIMNKKWLVSCLFAGALLLIAIAACNPMYTHAALQKTLTDELEQSLIDNNRYPSMAIVSGHFSQTSKDKYNLGTDMFPDYKTGAESLASQFKHEAVEKLTILSTSEIDAERVDVRSDVISSKISLAVNSMYGIEDHAKIVFGSMYGNDGSSDRIECIINENMMINSSLIIGDELKIPGFSQTFVVAGVFTAAEKNDLYWVNDPLSYNANLFISPENFDRLFIEGKMPFTVFCDHYAVFDYRSIKMDEINDFIISDNKIREDCKKTGLYSYEFPYEEPFLSYRSGTNKTNVTMWVFQTPVIILLCVFIFMVSNQIISIEQSEIAMLKSRGVSKRQLISAYFLQSGIISFAALILGIPLGYLFCTLFGATRSFLEFSVLTTIEVKITFTSILFALAATAASIIFMTIPVFKYANFSIVEQKANKKKHKKPLWQMVYLDFILLAVSLYGFYSYEKQREVIISNITEGSTIDPMLYFSSTIFILSIALIFLRIIPLLTTLIYKIGARKWKPATFAAFMQINKNIRKQSFIIVFLVLTLALGIFNATTARSINDNEERRLNYENGADLVLMQEWENNSDILFSGMSNETELVYYEPDFTVYNQIRDKTNGITKVIYDDKAGVKIGNEIKKDCTLFMAVVTDEFGKIAYMPEGVTKFHWYYYLNALAKEPYGAIISRNYAEVAGLKVGDTFNLQRTDQIIGTNKPVFNLTVVAIVDAWPGYEDSVLSEGKDGKETYTDNYLVVANYDTAHRTYSTFSSPEPYQIWIDAKDGTEFFYDFAEKNNLVYTTFKDSVYETDEMKEQPFFQVTSGMLTLAFLVILVLSLIGFLIYWVTSIKSRELLFGIYRAMGLSMKEIIQMLVYEHLFGSVIPIIYGVLAGILSAHMFVPLIQLAYSPKHSTLDTIVITSARDMLGLGVCVALMLVICFAVIGRLLSRMKIAQALKLGED